MPSLEAFTVKMNGFEKLGYCRIGGFISEFLRISKDLEQLSFQENFTFLLVKVFRGAAIIPKFGINFL